MESELQGRTYRHNNYQPQYHTIADTTTMIKNNMQVCEILN